MTHANDDVEGTTWLYVENAQLYGLVMVRDLEGITDAVRGCVDKVWLSVV